MPINVSHIKYLNIITHICRNDDDCQMKTVSIRTGHRQTAIHFMRTKSDATTLYLDCLAIKTISGLAKSIDILTTLCRISCCENDLHHFIEKKT